MSSRKRGSGADEIYSNHLYGKFKNNSTVNRTTVIERMYMRVLTELAVNRFKWTNLPDSVDVRFLEINLFYHALSVFYKDKRYDKFFALRGGGTNWLNMMDNPVGFAVIGNNFVGMNVSALRETENASKAIPIWANYLRIPDLDIVTVYARRFATLDRTIEINSENARMNKVIITDENRRLSVENIDRQIQEGQNNIKINIPLQDLQFIQALDLGVNPDAIEKLHILRTRWWNECMGLLGIDNANQDKKERLVSEEVGANDDQTSMMRHVNLNARQIAVEAINKEFGLDIKVEYHTDIDKRAEMIFEASLDDKGGVE